MGIIWKSTMVLLSTLAALVIIVHSAEEEYEARYRKESRPRQLDTGISRSYEQPWRTIEVEPQTSTPEETWVDNSTEEPIRRRRLGRKRKRQPDPSSAQDIMSQERYVYPEESVRPYIELDFSADRKITETPRRRRKKLDLRPSRWDHSADDDGLIRRRGQRKRPSSESWPEFSEFGDYRPSGGLVPVTQIDTVRTKDDFHNLEEHEDPPIQFKHAENFELGMAEETGLKPTDSHYTIMDKARNYQNRNNDDLYSLIDNRPDAYQGIPGISDDNKSASEITIEDITSIHHNIQNDEEHAKTREKLRDKQIQYSKEAEKAKDNGSIDPLTLKDILKRSNGTSLSEILQQHNLSLTDLLHGKDKVLSILKSEESFESSVSSPAPTTFSDMLESQTITNIEEKELIDDKLLLNIETQNTNFNNLVSENPVTIHTTEFELVDTTKAEEEKVTTEKSQVEEASKRPNIRRFPTSIRRKQRIRPVFNNTLKSQISRDMIALNARKYFNNRRRNSSHEWRDIIPVMKKNLTINEDVTKIIEVETTTAIIAADETTISQNVDIENCTKSETENDNISEILDEIYLNKDHKTDDERRRRNKTDTVKEIDDLQSAIYKNDKPVMKTTTIEPLNTLGLRRQAFNNRLNKKRIRQKNLTTEPPQDDILMNLFGIPNLVSSSEFISQTQSPKTRIDDVSIMEDSTTTEAPHKHENKTKASRYSPSRSATTSRFVIIPSSTEESAKIEIEEILNDTNTSEKLSKILMERNMTLNELVEHRERGSSHVHLADIFHNASKEPNSPEPFLSKSSIEPISKETYPLRALLDANIHDTTAKSTTIESVTATAPTTEVNIPVKMDFGHNVNENGENMGIMSLFNNITKPNIDKNNLMKDSEGAFYETTITVVNTTDIKNGSDTIRESRVIHVLNDNQDDIVSWNDIFTIMRKNYENSTDELTEPSRNDLIPAKIKPIEEDVDGDGLIVLEDLQQLKDFDSKFGSASNENFDISAYEQKVQQETVTPTKGILTKIPSQTKSVTIATASIAGLAMMVFLLTYVGYRWHQQRTMTRKKSFSNERVPTPVFENRKGHKNNNSSRSISPMLSSSNIYTLNTVDSRNGKESPDYMWDSLRKPFQ